MTDNNNSQWPVLVAAAGMLLVAAAAFAGEGFEIPPDRSPSTFLPASLVAGENFTIVDPVSSDGLMRRYAIDSRFGRFDAYGRSQLEIRVHEVAALTQLAKTSDVRLVTNGVEQGVETQVKTVTGVVTHPIKTSPVFPRVSHICSAAIAPRPRRRLPRARACSVLPDPAAEAVPIRWIVRPGVPLPVISD